MIQFLIRIFLVFSNFNFEELFGFEIETLVMREIKSATFQLLQVSPVEWLKFVEDVVHNGFHAVAVKVTSYAFVLFVIM
jgi:hypothetical protein